MDPIRAHQKECLGRIKANSLNNDLIGSARSFIKESIRSRYFYNFSWLGRPVIQFPQDLIMLQEIIWEIKPDLIIETGIAHGGSLVFFASMLENIGGNGEVLGIDIEIRPHNWGEITRHRMARRITMIEGSSVDGKVVAKVHNIVKGKKCVMVVLDSDHVHDHVIKELELYTPFVTKGSYCVVFDTYIEEYAPEFNVAYPHHDWTGDNPQTALVEFLRSNNRFKLDENIKNKLLITAAPGGYLKCLK